MCLGACTCTVVACFFSYCGNNVPRHFHSYSSIPYCEMNWLEFISGRFQSDSKNPGWCSSSSQSLKPNFQLFELKLTFKICYLPYNYYILFICRSCMSEHEFRVWWCDTARTVRSDLGQMSRLPMVPCLGEYHSSQCNDEWTIWPQSFIKRQFMSVDFTYILIVYNLIQFLYSPNCFVFQVLWVNNQRVAT